MPLKRRMKLKKSSENWCWINFKYEGVPTFYFICGMIGHGEKFCERLFDTPLDKIEKPYGVWMRAESRRKTHTMGAKWLRHGSSNQPANMGGDGGRRPTTVVQETNGEGEDQGVNLGGLVGNRKLDKVLVTGGNQGGNVIVDMDMQQLLPQNQEIQIQGGENSDKETSNEIFVAEPKRRRTDKPNSIGPNKVINQEVENMDSSENVVIVK